jgi:hypothetical protein
MIEVAKIIAKGPPPEWLVDELEYFSRIIGSDQRITPEVFRQYKKRVEQIREAVDTLWDLFAILNHLPRGLQPLTTLGFEEVALPRLREWLDQLPDKSGRRPHFGRELCADLIVWFWKRVNGKTTPRSDKIDLACEEYWRACGGKPSGDTENWRRMVEDAVGRDDPFLMHNLLIRCLGGTELASK